MHVLIRPVIVQFRLLFRTLNENPEIAEIVRKLGQYTSAPQFQLVVLISERFLPFLDVRYYPLAAGIITWEDFCVSALKNMSNLESITWTVSSFSPLILPLADEDDAAAKQNTPKLDAPSDRRLAQPYEARNQRQLEMVVRSRPAQQPAPTTGTSDRPPRSQGIGEPENPGQTPSGINADNGGPHDYTTRAACARADQSGFTVDRRCVVTGPCAVFGKPRRVQALGVLAYRSARVLFRLESGAGDVGGTGVGRRWSGEHELAGEIGD